MVSLPKPAPHAIERSRVGRSIVRSRGELAIGVVLLALIALVGTSQLGRPAGQAGEFDSYTDYVRRTLAGFKSYADYAERHSPRTERYPDYAQRVAGTR